jgi:hypothetical protein
MTGKNKNWKKDFDDIKTELLTDKVHDVFKKIRQTGEKI